MDALLRDVIRALYLLGAGQGLFLAAVLYGRGRADNRLLAAIMAVFSLDLAMALYHVTGASKAFPALIGLDTPATFLYGPLLYLYVQVLLRPDESPGRRDGVHFLPFLAAVVALAPFYVLGGPEKQAYLRGEGAGAEALALLGPIKLAHVLAYVAVVMREVWGRRARARPPSALRWARLLATTAAGFAGVAAVLFGLGARDAAPALGLDDKALYDDLTLLGLTVFVYGVGYLRLRRPEAPAESAGSLTRADRPRYAKSGLGPEDAARFEQALLVLMDEARPYRRGDLTLDELAAALGMSPHNLTELLNTRLGQSFYDFVNGYRVREAQALLVAPACASWSVLAVGLEAGFRSKSSFNATFKRLVGETPSAYRMRFANPR